MRSRFLLPAIILAFALIVWIAHAAQLIINVGGSANDTTGDTLRVAFQKANSNFSELYGATFTNGSAVYKLNGLTASNQIFTAGNSGTDFAISSSGTNHTFNIPTQSGSAVRGLLSSNDYATLATIPLKLSLSGGTMTGPLIADSIELLTGDGKIFYSSNNIIKGASKLVWDDDSDRLQHYAGGNPATDFSRLEQLWDSAAGVYRIREIVSGASNAIPFTVGINSGATLTFNTDGTATHSGGLGLSGMTNRLTVSTNTLLLDGQPVAVTGGTTNIFNQVTVTNLTVINTNIFNVSKGGQLTISNSLSILTIKTNLLATTADGTVTNANYGSGITWDPATLTISSSGGSGDTTGTNIVTLTQAGTNAAQMDFSMVARGGVFKLVLTNNAYFGVPANVNNTDSKEAWLMVQQPSTGTCLVTFTNSVFNWPSGVAPVNDTNAGAVVVYQFKTDVFTNGNLHGWMSLESRNTPR